VTRHLFVIIDAHAGVTSAVYYAGSPTQALEAFNTATADQWAMHDDPVAEYQRDGRQADVDDTPLPRRPGWDNFAPNQVDVFAVPLGGEEPGEATCCISMAEVRALYERRYEEGVEGEEGEEGVTPGKVD
jgi:hypothetical protein